MYRFVLLSVVDDVGFFGLLIAITSISSAACLIAITSQVSNGNIEQASQLSEYSNLVAIETFYNIIDDTSQNLSASQSFQSWVSAITTSARTNQISISVNNQSILISTTRNPIVTGVIS